MQIGFLVLLSFLFVSCVPANKADVASGGVVEPVATSLDSNFYEGPWVRRFMHFDENGWGWRIISKLTFTENKITLENFREDNGQSYPSLNEVWTIRSIADSLITTRDARGANQVLKGISMDNLIMLCHPLNGNFQCKNYQRESNYNPMTILDSDLFDGPWYKAINFCEMEDRCYDLLLEYTYTFHSVSVVAYFVNTTIVYPGYGYTQSVDAMGEGMMLVDDDYLQSYAIEDKKLTLCYDDACEILSRR